MLPQQQQPMIPYNYQADPLYNPYARLQQLEQQQAQYSQQQQPAKPLEIPFVGGVDGAKAFTMPNGSNAILMDNAEAMFYMVQSDQQGMRTIKAFQFQEVELKQPSAVDTSRFATKEDLQVIMQQLEEIKGGLSNGKSTNGTNAKGSK